MNGNQQETFFIALPFGRPANKKGQNAVEKKICNRNQTEAGTVGVEARPVGAAVRVRYQLSPDPGAVNITCHGRGVALMSSRTWTV